MVQRHIRRFHARHLRDRHRELGLFKQVAQRRRREPEPFREQRIRLLGLEGTKRDDVLQHEARPLLKRVVATKTLFGGAAEALNGEADRRTARDRCSSRCALGRRPGSHVRREREHDSADFEGVEPGSPHEVGERCIIGRVAQPLFEALPTRVGGVAIALI